MPQSNFLKIRFNFHIRIVHLDIIKVLFKSIYRYLRQYTTNICLTQFYFARGDMFRLLMQPSSGQLTIEQDIFMCAQYGIPHCLTFWSRNFTFKF